MNLLSSCTINMNMTPITSVFITVVLIIITSLFIRVVHIIQFIHNKRRRDICKVSSNIAQSTRNNKNESNKNNKQQQVKTMVILGSGGHTTEMIRLLQELDPCKYTPIVYVVTDSDTTSIPRLQKYIKEYDEGDTNESNGSEPRQHKSRWEGRYPVENCNDKKELESFASSSVASVHRLPRAREVHQSYLSSIFTTIYSFLQTLVLLYKIRPELLLTNGPGTCVPVIYSIFLFRLFSLNRSCKIIFIESLCRVQTLSLSGKLVYPIVDQFVVHWPYLKDKYPLVEICDVFVQHDDTAEYE